MPQITKRVFSFKALKVTAFMAFFAIMAAFVVAGSEAAFNGSTDNKGNSWSTGSVSLRDNDLETTLFNASNVQPGYTESRCILVTSDSSMNTNLFAQGTGLSGALQDALTVKVETGDGISKSCGDFANGVTVQPDISLTGFATATAATPLALGQLDAMGGKKNFRITVSLPADVDTTGLQGKSASFDFLWFNQSV